MAQARTIDTTIEGLLKEQEPAESFRNSFLHSMARIVSQMAGPSWRSGGESPGEVSGTNYAPDGRYFEYISSQVPSVISRTPVFDVTTPLGGAMGQVADAHERALNQWAHDVQLYDLGALVAVDMFVNWGILMVAPEEIPFSKPIPGVGGDWRTAKPWRAGVSRLDQRNHVRDPLATRAIQARYEGHNWVIDKDELVSLAEEGEGWSVEAVKELVTGIDQDTYARPEMHGVSRNEVLLSDWWVPEADAPESGGPEEGEFGAIFTFPHRFMFSDKAKSPQQIRDPRPWFGSPKGPYVTFGVYSVPNHATPLGPLTAADQAIQDLNEQTRAIQKADKDYKRIAITNSTKLARLIKAGKHDWVFADEALADAIVESLEFGGSTAQQHAQRQTQSDRLDRLLSQSEATQGNVTGVGTASENMIAAESRAISQSFVSAQFERAMSDVAERAAFIHHHDDRVVFAIRDEQGELAGYEEPQEGDELFQGGRNDPDSPFGFSSLQIRVRPKSMKAADEAAQKAATLQGLTSMLQVLPMMAQVPDGPWTEFWKLYGEALGVEQLERLAARFLEQELPPEAFLANDLGIRSQGQGNSLAGPIQGNFGGGQVSGGRSGVAQSALLSALGGNGAGQGTGGNATISGAGA